MPLVSIVIPAHNAAGYLDETLQSCLNQTHPDIEIILVDDGSRDHTRELVSRYPQVKYIYQENAGPAKARNVGIQHAHGEFLQFLDADDILLPTKIERCLSVFEEHPDTGLVYTGYELRSSDLENVIEKPVYQVAVVPAGMEARYMLDAGIPLFGIHCALMRTDLVRQVGGFDESLTLMEDWHLWVRIAAAGVVFRHVDEKLAWYRHAPGSLTRQELQLSRMRLKAYEHLRDVNLPENIDLEGKIADRHHVLAMKLWAYGQRAEARTHFQEAMRTHPGVVRSFLFYATYFLPANFTGIAVDWLGKLRKG